MDFVTGLPARAFAAESGKAISALMAEAQYAGIALAVCAAARKCQNLAGLKLLTGFDGCAKFTQAIDLETDEHALALTRSLKKTAVNPKKTRQRQSSEKD